DAVCTLVTTTGPTFPGLRWSKCIDAPPAECRDASPRERPSVLRTARRRSANATPLVSGCAGHGADALAGRRCVPVLAAGWTIPRARHEDCPLLLLFPAVTRYRRPDYICASVVATTVAWPWLDAASQ